LFILQCKKCSNTIEKDSLRIGKLERAQNFDGEIYVWHHPRCFFDKYPDLVKDINDIKVSFFLSKHSSG
jgi:hypothetical protein